MVTKDTTLSNIRYLLMSFSYEYIEDVVYVGESGNFCNFGNFLSKIAPFAKITTLLGLCGYPLPQKSVTESVTEDINGGEDSYDTQRTNRRTAPP